VKEEVALGCLTAMGITALIMGRNEGIYMTIINAVTAVILVAKSKKEETVEESES